MFAVSTDSRSPQEENAFNRMQIVKRRFYAMRNGALAAQMRAGGLEYRINFGLNVPQIKDIAAEIAGWGLSADEQADLARRLWDNATTRESRLLAPMIYPVEKITEPIAGQWFREVQTCEVADILCHVLLRRLPYAFSMASAVLSRTESAPLQVYAALRLLLNLLVSGRVEASAVRAVVDSMPGLATDAASSRLLRTLLAECDALQSVGE